MIIRICLIAFLLLSLSACKSPAEESSKITNDSPQQEDNEQLDEVNEDAPEEQSEDDSSDKDDSPAPSKEKIENNNTYVIKPTDTLYSIAKKFGITQANLEAWNHLSDPNKIQVGQTLYIKEPENFQATSEPENAPDPAAKNENNQNADEVKANSESESKGKQVIFSGADAVNHLRSQLKMEDNEEIDFSDMGGELTTDETGSYYSVQLTDLTLVKSDGSGTVGIYKVYLDGVYTLQ